MDICYDQWIHDWISIVLMITDLDGLEQVITKQRTLLVPWKHRNEENGGKEEREELAGNLIRYGERDLKEIVGMLLSLLFVVLVRLNQAVKSGANGVDGHPMQADMQRWHAQLEGITREIILLHAFSPILTYRVCEMMGMIVGGISSFGNSLTTNGSEGILPIEYVRVQSVIVPRKLVDITHLALFLSQRESVSCLWRWNLLSVDDSSSIEGHPFPQLQTLLSLSISVHKESVCDLYLTPFPVNPAKSPRDENALIASIVMSMNHLITTVTEEMHASRLCVVDIQPSTDPTLCDDCPEEWKPYYLTSLSSSSSSSSSSSTTTATTTTTTTLQRLSSFTLSSTQSQRSSSDCLPSVDVVYCSLSPALLSLILTCLQAIVPQGILTYSRYASFLTTFVTALIHSMEGKGEEEEEEEEEEGNKDNHNNPSTSSASRICLASPNAFFLITILLSKLTFYYFTSFVPAKYISSSNQPSPREGNNDGVVNEDEEEEGQVGMSSCALVDLASSLAPLSSFPPSLLFPFLFPLFQSSLSLSSLSSSSSSSLSSAELYWALFICTPFYLTLSPNQIKSSPPSSSSSSSSSSLIQSLSLSQDWRLWLFGHHSLKPSLPIPSSFTFPLFLLCWEQEGRRGRFDHPKQLAVSVKRLLSLPETFFQQLLIYLFVHLPRFEEVLHAAALKFFLQMWEEQPGLCMASFITPEQPHCCGTAEGRITLLNCLPDSSFLTLLRRKKDALANWAMDIQCLMGGCEVPVKRRGKEMVCGCGECAEGDEEEGEDPMHLIRFEQYHVRERLVQRIRLVLQEKEWKNDKVLLAIKRFFPELR